MVISSSKRPFPLFTLLTILCAGLLLTPLLTGCSKKDPKAAKTAAKKKGTKGTAKKTGKAPAKPAGKTAAKPAKPAAFTWLVSYENIPLNVPFEPGETETLMKVDPVKGISLYETERFPGGKIMLNAATNRIIRIEVKKKFGTEQEATAAFEARKGALEKAIGLPPIPQMQGVGFSETTASGEGRSIQLIHSGPTVFEVVSVSDMPKNPVVFEGRPVNSLFGLELGVPIPEKMVNENGMMLFYPDYPRSEFKVYNYFNDSEGKVQTVMAKSDPARTIYQAEVLDVVRWLEEKFAMKMSYEGESAVAGVFQYSKGSRGLDLRWKDGKLTLSARILAARPKITLMAPEKDDKKDEADVSSGKAPAPASGETQGDDSSSSAESSNPDPEEKN